MTTATPVDWPALLSTLGKKRRCRVARVVVVAELVVVVDGRSVVLVIVELVGGGGRSEVLVLVELVVVGRSVVEVIVVLVARVLVPTYCAVRTTGKPT